MKNCKNCIQFLETETEYRCLALGTVCTPHKDPDLGHSLRMCEYEPKKKEKKKNENID